MFWISPICSSHLELPPLLKAILFFLLSFSTLSMIFCNCLCSISTEPTSVLYFNYAEQILVTIFGREFTMWHDQQLKWSQYAQNFGYHDLWHHDIKTISKHFCLPNFIYLAWVNTWYNLHTLSNSAACWDCLPRPTTWKSRHQMVKWSESQSDLTILFRAYMYIYAQSRKYMMNKVRIIWCYFLWGGGGHKQIWWICLWPPPNPLICSFFLNSFLVNLHNG